MGHGNARGKLDIFGTALFKLLLILRRKFVATEYLLLEINVSDIPFEKSQHFLCFQHPGFFIQLLSRPPN